MADIRLDEGMVATITIDRPEVANCLSRATLDELRDALDAVAKSDARAVIVTGSGSKAFSAGADMKERAGMSGDKVLDYINTIRDTITAIAKLPQPVIAAINGVAFGGGCEIALACDIRVMSSAAHIGLTETGLGIIPGGGGTQRLPRIVGPARAIELITTARRVDAGEALRILLVHEIATDALARSREIAERIAANAPIAVRAAKEALWAGLDLPLDEGLALETKLYERCLGTTDRLEGLAAFREKRRPSYRGT